MAQVSTVTEVPLDQTERTTGLVQNVCSWDGGCGQQVRGDVKNLKNLSALISPRDLSQPTGIGRQIRDKNGRAGDMKRQFRHLKLWVAAVLSRWGDCGR